MTTRENEYAIRRLLRLSPKLSGMGERYLSLRTELSWRLKRAQQYRRLTAIEEMYL